VTQNVDHPSRSSFVDALSDLRVVHGGHCRADLSAPWGVDTSACLGPSFHFVAEGRCVLHYERTRRTLRAGDLVVFTRKGARLTSAVHVPERWMLHLPTAASPHLRVLRHGGGGTRTLLLSGGAQFDPPEQPLVRVLPDVLVVRADDPDAGASVKATLKVMTLEVARPDAGDETVIARLCDVLVIHAVRVWLRELGDGADPRADGIHDEHFARALALMHRHPERSWTVAGLASAAHMSRTAFARRFTRVIGLAPLTYLTRHRMQAAARLLATTDLTIAEVADRVGFASTAAFSRAFKRASGRAPSEARARDGHGEQPKH
jgi:AraC-like DNA-binding protein